MLNYIIVFADVGELFEKNIRKRFFMYTINIIVSISN